MKLLTVAIPCYNSQEYMKHAIESALVGGEDIEILIVDDGSKDDTAKIADEFEAQYPGIIRAIHQENGGHGEAVNAGLRNAKGLYYKVLDSDDWLDQNACLALLGRIRHFAEDGEGACPDLFICNYVYDHLDEGIQKPMNYKNIFPVEKVCGWNEIGHFRPSQYLIMHALMFRTQVLRESGVKLPEHTFYVDNLFSYQPLPYAKTLYYMDLDLYHYYLGRDDQSVNEKVLMKRIDQQMKVTELVAKSVDLHEVKRTYPKLAVYMMRNISIMLSISSIHLLLIETKEAWEKRRVMWEHIRDYDRGLYYRLRCTTLSGFTYLPGKIGGKLTVGGYRMARRIYQFQ